MKEFVHDGKKKVLDWLDLYTTSRANLSNISWRFMAFELAFDYKGLNVVDIERETKKWTGYKTVKYHSMDNYQQFILPTAMLTNRTNQLHTYQKSCEQMRMEYQVNDKADCLIITNVLGDSMKPKMKIKLPTLARSRLTRKQADRLELRQIKKFILEHLKKMEVNPYQFFEDEMTEINFKKSFVNSLANTMKIPTAVLEGLINATSYDLTNFDEKLKRKLREKELIGSYDRKRKLYFPTDKTKAIQFTYRGVKHLKTVEQSGNMFL